MEDQPEAPIAPDPGPAHPEMEKSKPTGQRRAISIEAAVAIIVTLVNLALDQADIHIMLASWISIIACIVLAVDILRRTKWTAHAIHGRRRLALGSSAILLGFLALGIFLSVHKKAIGAQGKATEQATVLPAGRAPQPKTDPPDTPNAESEPSKPQVGKVPSTLPDRKHSARRSETAQSKPAATEVSSTTAPVPPPLVGTMTVQPGGVASVGQQGGITAGQVIVEDTALTIRSLEIRMQLDYPTEIRATEATSFDNGWRDVMALFDTENKRYGFVGSSFEFENYQKEPSMHHVAFKYVPEDSNDMFGQSINGLSRMDTASFNLSGFFKDIPHPTFGHGPAKITMAVVLNGVTVLTYNAPGTIEVLTQGQVGLKVGTGFTNIRTVYVALMRNRLSK